MSIDHYNLKGVFKMSNNLILDVDSYKFGHYPLYPDGLENQSSYIQARIKNEIIVPFGLQMWIKKTLLTPITLADIDEAEELTKMRGDPFNREGFEYILNQYSGYYPITIKAIPEGMPVDSSTPLVVVETDDPKLAWLPSFIETTLQRGIWYPTTIATNDRKNWLQLKYFYDKGSDNKDMMLFALHDFSGRGVTCREQAEIGGIAHLIYFRGTDTISAIVAGRKYYNTPMAGFSVLATEHSLQCAYGKDHQKDYFKKVLDTYAKPGAIVSIVLDGYDVYRESELLSTEFKQQIIDSGAKIVFRPDSGDMFEVVPRILKIQADNFGYIINSKGKKMINNVGIIQGDGIDSLTMSMLAQRVCDLGYAPECVIYGSGGGLMQKVNRDTYKFAQKTSAMKINGEWIDTVKDPITDPGKKSKGGRQIDSRHVTYYHNGKLLIDEDMETIRARAIVL